MHKEKKDGWVLSIVCGLSLGVVLTCRAKTALE